MVYVEIVTKSKRDKKKMFYFTAMALHTYFASTTKPKIKPMFWLDDLIAREFDALMMATGECLSTM